MGAKHKNKDFTFAQRLETVMIKRGLYPRDVQKLTGVHRQSIYEYLQGIKQPTAYNIARIAKGLSVSADWLLGLKE